jgi:hypothetical protein
MARFFGILVIFLILSIVPIANAQISLGEKANQKSVEVMIGSDGSVHVKHVIRASDSPVQVDLIYGTVSNLSVTSEDGEKRQLSVIGNNEGVLILPSKNDSIVEYDLQHVLSQIDDVWTWSFRYLETTSFYLPEEADLIFANEKPIFLDEKKGIACHGCQMVLEYSINEPKTLEDVKWEDKEFVVEIRSHSEIDKFIFDQPTKSITLDVKEDDRFVTVIIPLELLWEPYTVSLDDEKIYFHEYINNGTHAWVNMRPEHSGEISIIGTTVVPEFPDIAPLVVGFLIIAILPVIRKVNLR